MGVTVQPALAHTTHYPAHSCDTLNLTLQEFYLALTMSKLNTNRYATKKTIAQGMLDIALLSTNAAQLKYILTVGEEHEYYLPMLILIVASIVLQVLNGLTQVLMGPLNLDKEEFKSFLNAVNYISMFLSYGIVGIDAIKAIFFPQTIFSAKK